MCPLSLFHIYLINVPFFVPSFVPYRAHILLCPPLYSKCTPLSLFYVFINPEKGQVLYLPKLFKLNPKYYVKTNAPTFAPTFAPTLGAYFHAPTFI